MKTSVVPAGSRTVVLRHDHRERNPVHIKSEDGLATLCGYYLPVGYRGRWTAGTNFERLDMCKNCLRRMEAGPKAS